PLHDALPIFEAFTNSLNPVSNVARNVVSSPPVVDEEQEPLTDDFVSQTATTRNVSSENSQDNQREITFTVDTPLVMDEPIPKENPSSPDSPVLRVEKVVEEKAITANDLVAEFGEYDPRLDLSGYQYPTLDLLKEYGNAKITINQQELEANKNHIVEKLRNYSIEIEHIKATIVPTVTLYQIILKPTVRISKIKNLEHYMH